MSKSPCRGRVVPGPARLLVASFLVTACAQPRPPESCLDRTSPRACERAGPVVDAEGRSGHCEWVEGPGVVSTGPNACANIGAAALCVAVADETPAEACQSAAFCGPGFPTREPQPWVRVGDEVYFVFGGECRALLGPDVGECAGPGAEAECQCRLCEF